MFGLFRRTKIERWEIGLLRNTIRALPVEFRYLEKQIDKGLFRGARIDSNYKRGYVGFTFNGSLVGEFENKNDKEYKLTNIKVLNKKTKTFLKYSIYVYNGLIIGYLIEGAEKFSIDVNDIVIEMFKKEFQLNKDYEKVKKS